MLSPPGTPALRHPRLELIDALRAFALFGILQVNIQSFVWGAGDPLGYFAQAPRTADSMAYLLVAMLVSSKFIALFALLFGFGFALQFRALHRAMASQVSGAPVLKVSVEGKITPTDFFVPSANMTVWLTHLPSK